MIFDPSLYQMQLGYGGSPTALGDTTGGMLDSLGAVGVSNPTYNPLLGPSEQVDFGAAASSAGGAGSLLPLLSMIGGNALKNAMAKPNVPVGSQLVGAGGVYQGDVNTNGLMALQQQAYQWAKQNPRQALGLLSTLMGR